MKRQIDWSFVGMILSFLFIIGILYVCLMGNKSVFVNSYQTSSPITVQTYNIGTRDMEQTISFTNQDGETIVLKEVLFEGDINADTIYVWRIGQWEWQSSLRIGYKYLVTDKDISPKTKDNR